jgi:hypothetical protein
VAQAPHYFVPEFQKLIEEEFSNNDDELHAALRMSDPDLVVRILPSSMVSFVGYRRKRETSLQDSNQSNDTSGNTSRISSRSRFCGAAESRWCFLRSASS